MLEVPEFLVGQGFYGSGVDDRLPRLEAALYDVLGDGGTGTLDVAHPLATIPAGPAEQFDYVVVLARPPLAFLLAVLLSIAGYALVRLGWRCCVVQAWRARRKRRLHE